jgi:PAS domain S-box-containing protein
MLRILLLEDSLLDTELIQAYLTDGGIDCELVRVETRTDFQTALETQSFALILCDYSLPAFDGIAALAMAQATCPDVPLILVSATLGEELAIETLKRGATDYVLKQRLERLVPAVKRALREMEERVERKRAEAALRELAAQLERRVEERTAELATVNESLRAEIAERQRVEQWLRRSESTLRSYFELPLIGIAISSPDKSWIEVNEKLCDILGYERQELIQLTWLDLTYPEDLQADLEQFNQVLAGTSEGYSIDKRFIRKDGQVIWVSVSTRCVRQADGSIDYFVALAQDITDAYRQAKQRKLAEDALRLSDEILKQMPDAVMLTDLDLIIQTWTGKAEQMFGYTAAEAVGKSATFLLNSDSQILTTARITDAIHKTGKFCGEIIGRRKDGCEVPIETTAKILCDAGGNPVGFLSINRDITERKRAQAQREQLIREQVARHEAEVQGQKSAFLAEVSTVLASSLDYETTLATVAKLAVPLLADWCTVDIVEDNHTLRRVAIAHLDPAKEELAWELNRRCPDQLSAMAGLPEVLRTGQSALAAEISDSNLAAVAQDVEHLQALRELGLTSCIVVPLIARGRTLGAISFITAESSRRYSADDLPLVEDLARRAAIAVDNARLYQETQAARRIAEQTAERNAALQTLTAALSEALSLTQVGEIVVNQALTALKASAGFMVLLVDCDSVQPFGHVSAAARSANSVTRSDSEVRASAGRSPALSPRADRSLEVVSAVGYPQEILNIWSRFPITAEVPIADAVRTQTPILLESRAVWAESYPHLATQYADSQHHAWVALPLIADRRTVGGIGFSFLNARTFSEDDCAFMQALAQQCAQAIQRARAYAAERQARAESEAARSAAEAANRMKDEFLATLSHELRTPLNAMQGWTHLLRTRKFDQAKMERALETIDRNTQSLSALIEDILDISRIITGKLRLSVAPCELVPLIEAAIETVQPAAEAKMIQIERCLDASAGPILGDATRLQQVVWNLLSNAIKFTPKGGRVEVRLDRVDTELHSNVVDRKDLGDKEDKAEKILSMNATSYEQLTPKQDIDKKIDRSNSPECSGSDSEAVAHLVASTTTGNQCPNIQYPRSEYAQIQVIDMGKGITPDFLPYVFERFRQENSSSTRSYGGLGLGLAIVRYLVEQHGGMVQAFSEGDGMGATFTVQLPLLSVPRQSTPSDSVQPSVDGVAYPQELQALTPASEGLSLDTAKGRMVLSHRPLILYGLRVLVVEDEADARELLVTILEQNGAQVRAAASAGQALNLLFQSNADVLVSDIGMPNIDGYTLIRRIRQLEASHGRDIPAIALTAYAGERERIAALEAGFQVHLPKPFDSDELVEVVAKLAGRKPTQPAQ